MRSIFAMAFVGVLASVSNVYAADQTVPAGREEKELKCRFEGRDFDQNDNLRCFVRVETCKEKMGPGAQGQCERGRDDEAFQVRCTNGFELESRDFAVGRDRDNIWINADERGDLATLRLKFRHDEPQVSSDRRIKADLLISNRKTRHLEGSCSFDRDDHGHDDAPELN